MIQRSVIVKVVIFAIVTVLGVTYTAVRYVRVGSGLLRTTTTVYVDLEDAGGIFPNAEVTYRGVPVGRVGTITLTDNHDGVTMALLIDRARNIPNDVDIVIANGSAIGEQYVDLQPHRAAGPYLKTGDTIPRDRTTQPVSTAKLLLGLDKLVNSVPKDDLNTVITELGLAFAETGPDLQRIIDASHALLTAAQANLPQTVRLLEDSRTVLDTQRVEGSAIAAFSRNLASLTKQLRVSDSDLRGVLDNGVPAALQLSGLVEDVSATLPVLLGNLVHVGQVAAVHVNDLKQVLILYPYLVAASFTVFPGDGTVRFGVPMNQTGIPPACTVGYPDPSTFQRPPEDTKTRAPYPFNSYCKALPTGPEAIRGTRNAPANRANRTSSNDVMPAKNYRVASTGGQQRVMGDSSWQWLLVGPMGDASEQSSPAR
jgi:phospholipid/cholesterol/gamma-HCH transport system substrate-binding protein